MKKHTPSLKVVNTLALTKMLLCWLANISLILGIGLSHALAEESQLVEISDHWVRESYPGQSVGAAYMTFKSHQDVTLTHVSANVSKAIEVHEMKMVNNIMKMRQLPSLTLPKGKAVSLKPGGLHLMLFDLAHPLKAGQTVHFELCFADKAGEVTIIPLSTKVKAAGHNHHH